MGEEQATRSRSKGVAREKSLITFAFILVLLLIRLPIKWIGCQPAVVGQHI
jgi:hypothetical protein